MILALTIGVLVAGGTTCCCNAAWCGSPSASGSSVTP